MAFDARSRRAQEIGLKPRGRGALARIAGPGEGAARRRGCSGDLRPVEVPGCCAAGGDARALWGRWRCPGAVGPVEMPGRCGAGGDARALWGRWRCPAVLPPVEIRGGPLCRRFLPGGGCASPRSCQRHRALARPMPWHTPLRAGTRRRRALRALVVTGPPVEVPGGTLRVPHTGPAERLHGWALEPRMGITAFPVSPRCAALSADRAVFQEEREALLASYLGRWLRKLRARSARRRRVPARGGGSRHRARQRTMSCDRAGGTQSPPSQNRRQNDAQPAAERAAANLNRRQNSRASQPAPEHPRISTR
jgi:hypothetical protein